MPRPHPSSSLYEEFLPMRQSGSHCICTLSESGKSDHSHKEACSVGFPDPDVWDKFQISSHMFEFLSSQRKELSNASMFNIYLQYFRIISISSV